MTQRTATAAGQEPAAVQIEAVETRATDPILPPGARAVKPAGGDCPPWRRYCQKQAVRYLSLAERWLDLAETAP